MFFVHCIRFFPCYIVLLLFLGDCVFIKFDHGILRKENGFQNCFCEFLLGFLAHSFSAPQGNAFSFYRLTISSELA